ncbi:hypothetical protein RFI_06633 [Reticulomyxa filosa]|uniref:Uncharacterized protein n=1 Tax=Reticulomyxa filosa TaxID=46433 RepID=X6NX73_RETFI|nr:hypothetical protein RFI_06633 [Reticulomyxa filosa]|eukprot:ETO30488.1 hypothetical protein RFI_06633 [Reticulomyxa filosa]
MFKCSGFATDRIDRKFYYIIKNSPTVRLFSKKSYFDNYGVANKHYQTKNRVQTNNEQLPEVTTKVNASKIVIMSKNLLSSCYPVHQRSFLNKTQTKVDTGLHTSEEKGKSEKTKVQLKLDKSTMTEFNKLFRHSRSLSVEKTVPNQQLIANRFASDNPLQNFKKWFEKKKKYIYIVKYGRRGKPHHKLITLNTTDGWLTYESSKFHLATLEKVQKGCSTKIFKRHTILNSPETCFSLIFPQRSLDLQTANAVLLDAVFEIIENVAGKFKTAGTNSCEVGQKIISNEKNNC